MPSISNFYGIYVYIYFDDAQRHHLPHFHAEYQDENVVLAIEDGSVLAGGLPPRQLRMAQDWARLHRKELLADWTVAKTGGNPASIEPLP